MKRYFWLVAAGGVLLVIAWGLRSLGGLSASREQEAPVSIRSLKNLDPLNTNAGWRFRQNLPHHWRYVMLQK